MDLPAFDIYKMKPSLNQITNTLHYMKKDSRITAHFDLESEEGYDTAFQALESISDKQFNYLKVLIGYKTYRGKDGQPGAYQLLERFGFKKLT